MAKPILNINILYLKEKIIVAFNKVKFCKTNIKYLIFNRAMKNYSCTIEMLLSENDEYNNKIKQGTKYTSLILYMKEKYYLLYFAWFS